MKYCWVGSLQAFEHWASLGWVPILRPLSREKALAWERALAFYGCSVLTAEDALQDQSPRPCALNPHKCQDIVVVLSPALQPFAGVFALRTARSLYKVRSSEGLKSLVATRRPASVTVFADRRKLDGPELKALSDLNISHGVVTGRDDSAISFFVAKLLAPPARCSHANIVMDAFNSKISKSSKDGKGILSAVLTTETVQSLVQEQWNSAAILCHGEGSHLKLGPSVGCGAADINKDNHGHEIAGCDNGVSCRRTTNGTELLSLSSVQAEHVWLLSCWGFSVAGEVYPSNASAILSLAEGCARSVISARGIVTSNAWSVPIAFDLIKRGVGLGFVAQILSDLFAPSTGYSPLTLLGDPSGLPPPMVTMDAAGRLPPEAASQPCRQEASARTVRYFLLGPYKDAILGLHPEGAGLVRGQHYGAVFARSNQAVQLVDYSAWRAERIVRLKEVSEKLESAGLLQRWFVGHFEDRESGRVPAWLEELAGLRDIVERRFTRASAEAAVVTRCLVWSDQLDTKLSQLDAAIDDWDQRLAEAIHCEWYEKSGVYITTDQWKDPLAKQYAPCEVLCSFCKRPLQRTLFSAFEGGPHYFIRESCTIHELHQFYPASHSKVGLVVPKRIELSQRVVFSLRLDLGARMTATPSRLGWLVGAAHDNAVSKRWYAHCDRVSARSFELETSVPSDANPTQHVFRFAWAYDMQLHLVRTMLPLVLARPVTETNGARLGATA